MGNMFTVGVSVATLLEAQPKKAAALLAPSKAKLFTDNGANWQGVWVGVTSQSSISSIPVTPVGLHSGGMNICMTDGSARFVNRSELQGRGGPSLPIQTEPKQNWWRDGAVELLP